MTDIMSWLRGMTSNPEAKDFAMDLVTLGVRLTHWGRQLIEWLSAAEDPKAYANAIGYVSMQPEKELLDSFKKRWAQGNNG